MAGSMGYVVLKPDCEIGCCLGAPTASRIIVKRRSNTDGDSAGGSFVFPVPRGRKSIARVRKPLETGTNTSQNPNGVNVGWNCDQSRSRVGGAYWDYTVPRCG